MDTRRHHLKILGASAVALSSTKLAAQEHMHAGGGPHYTVPAVPPFEPKFFTADEGAVVARIAELIIPETGTPGASTAGAPHYIDLVVSRNPAQQGLLREGIAWLDAESARAHQKKFVELSEDSQIAMLTPLSVAADGGTLGVPGAKFFKAMKNLTVEAYYGSYAGLVQELGYQGNQALAHFDGCTHPTE